jgi:hypothetical protein
LRIPTITTTHSDELRRAVPIDYDQCGAMTGIAVLLLRALRAVMPPQRHPAA